MRVAPTVAWRSVLTITALFVAANRLPAATPSSGCLQCHKGIEPIRQSESEMMQEILELGRSKGDPAGCVVCHGGDPTAKEKEPAHGQNKGAFYKEGETAHGQNKGAFHKEGETAQGPNKRAFYPDPGSPWINRKTCGLCHPEQVGTQWHSLMMTEAGKIQGTAWAFGSMTGYEHKWGNYDVENPARASDRLGTDTYRSYMAHLKALQPQVFVDRHQRLPDAPTDLAKLAEHPELAAFTYLRNQCQRCHHAVKGRQLRGDYRGMGCSGCHIPYGNEGYYEGADKSIARDKPGHCLVHSIQATRDAKLSVHDRQYSGIPVETCTVCHNRGKRIGVSFQGLMETAYESPNSESGGSQPALHTKHYLAMHQDIHYQKGMVCQDCHTSIDVHGDGFLAACNLASVEIECSDCHGTPRSFPWELPQGFMDEFAESSARGPARGTAKNVLPHARQGTEYPARDGYLLSARGNPLGNAVRDGNKVIVHTAGGKDLELKPLKLIEQEKQLSMAGLVAMRSVRGHLDRMECYTCHTSWTPQCYGCHARIDYSKEKTSFDWLAAGHRHMRPECKAQRGETGYNTIMPGQISEQRSYLRWEDAPLGVNGEGRVTPVAPGCQVSVTVIGADGKPILLNHIFRTSPGTEGSGGDGQLALDMSPIHPHTMTKHARACESCHASEKALGYGIDGGRAMRLPNQPTVVELETTDGHILPERYQTQIASIDNLTADWSRFVTEKGQQLQTVGHHLKGSRPLNDGERALVSRQGVCLSCHQEIPDRSLAVSLLHHVAEFANQIPKTTEQHDSLLHKLILMAGWGQVGAVATAPLFALAAALWFWRRRRQRK